MKKYMKRAISFSLAAVLLMSLMVSGALAATVNGQQVAGQGLYIMDYETGIELYNYNGDQTFVPASITKLMTVYLVYQAIERGDISWDTRVPISDKVRSQSLNRTFNNVPLSQSEYYTVEEIVNIVIVYSACGATVALAELLAGTEEEFVKRMNAEAQRLGIDATYYGASGTEDNYVSPRAMATLARHMISEYPDILTITSKTSYNLHGTTWAATNNMLPGQGQYYLGVDGFKSGTTTNAGYCFVGTAEVNGVRLITVVFKSSSATQRYRDTKVLLDYGFSIREEKYKETFAMAPYTDVYTTDWFAQQVADIVETGIMTGTSATSFEPMLTLDNATTLTTLYRICGSPAVSYSPTFDDVEVGEWHTNAVLWAQENGIFTMYDRYNFGVYESTSREQFALMLMRCVEHLGGDTSKRADLQGYLDRSSISPWAYEAMQWAVAEGIVTGTGDNMLSPRGTTDRAQCATLLLRFMNLLETNPVPAEADVPA